MKFSLLLHSESFHDFHDRHHNAVRPNGSQPQWKRSVSPVAFQHMPTRALVLA